MFREHIHNKVSTVVLLLFTTTLMYTTYHCSHGLSVESSTFSKVLTNGILQILTTYPNYRSTLECAYFCHVKSESVPQCQGFRFNTQSRVCELYTEQIDEVFGTGMEIYKLLRNSSEDSTTENPTTTTTSTATSTSIATTTSHETLGTFITFADYSYHLSTETKTYEKARDHCSSFGHWLLHIDSAQELTYVSIFLTMQSALDHDRAWVGADDLDNDGTFKCKKHGTPLEDEGSGGWQWEANEPNNPNEDCAVIIYNSLKLNDHSCTDLRHYICEKEVP